MNSEELADVLDRAQQIQQMQQGATEYEEVTRAAEELGISREATLQALRERLGTLPEAPVSGQMVFARSADGHYYLAKVIEASENNCKIRYLSGGEADVSPLDMRVMALAPGLRVEIFSPSVGGWTGGTISQYNQDAQSLKVMSWGSQENISLDAVRLSGHSKPTAAWMHYFWVAAGSGVLGALIHWLVTR